MHLNEAGASIVNIDDEKSGITYNEEILIINKNILNGISMRFFTKVQKNQGWLTLVLFSDGIGAVRVKRSASARPTVELCTFFPADGVVSAEQMGKVGRELRAGSFRCSTVLNGRDYQLLTVDAPNVPLTELKDAIRWRLKDMIDFPIDEATMDILDIPVDKNIVSQVHSMFVAAARNTAIVERQTLFADAKIRLTVIDIPEMAQRNLSALMETEGRGVAMLSFSATGGLLTVSFNGELYLSRRIDVVLAQLFDADPAKKEASFDKITLELQRSLDHFDRQFHFINIAKLVLAPTGASGLLEYLTTNLYTPVEAMNLAELLDLSKAPLLADEVLQQRYFMALGASLRLEVVAL